MEELFTQLNEDFKESLGVHPFTLIHSSKISLDDESGLETIIYSANPHAPQGSHEIFCEKIMQSFNLKISKMGLQIASIIDKELTSQWDTEKGDTFKLHICDHSIYLTIFYSGQY